MTFPPIIMQVGASGLSVGVREAVFTELKPQPVTFHVRVSKALVFLLASFKKGAT